jgi:steroid delta-isomerase-like uncharacterized protein
MLDGTRNISTRSGRLALAAPVFVMATIFAYASSGSASTPAGSSSMAARTSPSNKEIVRSVYEVSLNTGDMDHLNRVVAPDFVGVRGEVGPVAFARTLVELRTAFPDIRYTVEDLIEEGDRVAIRWTWTGTHQGPFRGLAASGKRVSNSGFAIFQLRDGRIARSWLETDRLGFLQQIGALPPELSARLQPGAKAR